MFSKFRVSALVLAFLTLFSFTSSALAASPSSHPGSGAGATNASSSAQGGQLQACQAHENAIKQRSLHLTDLATGMEAKFSTIAQRVEDYYTSKVEPSGKVVANYNSLVTDIQNKKAAVAAELSKSSSDANSFSCSSTNPKGQITQFRIDMQGVIKALKDYRTSIKNLIVAVHSVTGNTNSNENATSSAHPASGSAESSGDQ